MNYVFQSKDIYYFESLTETPGKFINHGLISGGETKIIYIKNLLNKKTIKRKK
jgi:hypothetical protein